MMVKHLIGNGLQKLETMVRIEKESGSWSGLTAISPENIDNLKEECTNSRNIE